MADLSHWIFAKDFTVYEAAFLILGIDPSKDTDAFSTRHIQERMEEAYEGALSNLRHLDECFLPDWAEKRSEQLIEPHKTLKSVQISKLLNFYYQGDEVCIGEWLLSGRNQIHEQRFSREEIAQWISKNKLPSVYRFLDEATLPLQKVAESAKPLCADPAPPGCWPWGGHHTELLGHLEAAAREFWTGYNPQNAKATAPKNESVIAWLEARNVPGQKKKVSNQMATAIASMLRPDDLPTGPRK